MKKKNLIARLGVLALVFTLVTTTLVSGTYSKYVTQVTGSDTARVAKFAFNLSDSKGGVAHTQAVTTGTFNIFDNTDAGVFINTTNIGSDGKKLIAPGTTGTVTFSVSNSSEVKVTQLFAISETNTGNIPVYYTYKTKNYSSILTGTGIDGNLAALATALTTDSTTLAATNGTAGTAATYVIGWTWDFAGIKTGQADATDTTLGIAGSATVALNITATVTQSDT